jgi:uncharacterized protein (DUF302 family)
MTNALIIETKTDPAYGLTAHLKGLSVEQAREAIIAALKEQGFGVLTEIDVQKTLKQKLDHDFAPYLILGACNPGLAERALRAEPGIGLLLPCNVCLWAEADGAVVSIAKPRELFGVVDRPGLEEIAGEAEDALARALAQVVASHGA